MQKIKKLFTNRWFWSFVGAILFGLIIWFVGPMIAVADFRPFGWWPVTLFVALLPFLLVLIFCLLAVRREKKKNAAMMEELKPDPAAIERDEIAAKLSQALDQLRTARLGSRQAFAYQLPWYAIIGPSGAGKTTALLNCGLEFPTAVAGEYRALRGQPNTPNCDWWFTSEAVLIDTAGRYVSQDEDKEQDAAGWKNFLDLLKKYRPLQPLNGLIVAIPAPDFMDARKMEGHTQNVRERLAETTNLLGQNLPIYLMVTKTDLLPGFREFFARATDDESDQVFGSTAPGDKADPEAVLVGFDGLVTSISSRVVDRMQNESDLQRRASIAGFPGQLASLRAPVAKLLEELTKKTRFDQPARVRGVYFSSGTQSGSPVDRILMNVGAPPTASQNAVGSGRSYFLRRFFADLLVPEHGIASRNPAAEARARRNYAIGIGAMAALFVVALGVWTWGYFRNAALIERVYAITADYSNVAGESRGGSATVQQDLAALGVLGNGTTEMAEASDFALGLGQGGRLNGEMRGIYGRDLQRRLMPILMSLAEERMASDNPGEVYDALKSYLILGGEGPEQAEHVMAWVPRAWLARAGGNESEAGALATHTAALFDIGFTPQGIDVARKENARRILRAQPPAVRVYGRLKSEALASGERQWTARENAGPRPELLFAQSGAFAPSAGVPALFTRNGYDNIFLPIVERGPELLEDEVWVVGDSASEQLTPNQIAQLRSDLERLYFDDFLDHWNTYLGLIELRPVNGLEDNVQRLRDAGGPLSPLAPLLRAIAEVTDLTPAAPAAGGGGGAEAGEMAVEAAARRNSTLNRAVTAGERVGGAGGGSGGAAGPGGGRQAVIQAFLPLRQFVGPAEGGGPMDGVLATFTQVANALNGIAVLGGGDGSTGAQQSMEARAAILQLRQNGNSLPLPMSGWALDMAGDAEGALGMARGAQMGAAMDANFANCGDTMATAYPIQAASSADLPIESFAQIFGPTGTFASFVNTQLNNYIDTTQPDWALKPNAGEVGLTQGSVRAFQAANRVTRTFFAGDPTSPRLSYQIEPVSLSGAESVVLEIDGQQLTYNGTNPVPATFDWPGAGGATLQFSREGANVSPRAFSGPWALFRMMKLAAIRTGPSPLIGVGSLTHSGARFDFRIRTFGASNPFVSDPFVQVACPDIDAAALAYADMPLVLHG